MRDHSIQQKHTERKYYFPYHYIPHMGNMGFQSFRFWRYGYEYLSYINYILNRLKHLRYKRLLDVGCGDGRLLHEINMRSRGKKLVGLDYSQRAINFAIAMNPNLEFKCINIIEDEMRVSEQFDIITLIETLEHISLNEIDAFVKSLATLLKMEGILIISVPSTNIPTLSKHFQHFDLESLKKLIKPYFLIKFVKYLNIDSNIVRTINNLFINKYFIINQMRLRNLFYRWYIQKYFHANRNNARRIYVECKRIK